MNKFKTFLATVASLASVIGIGVAGYQIGQSTSASSSDGVVVEVQNSIEAIISSLDQEEQEAAQNLLTPVSNLVVAASRGDEQTLVEARTNLTKTLTDGTLVSYKAERSPFVPPLDKVQLLCDGEFLLTYYLQTRKKSWFRVATPKESRGMWSSKPGELKSYESENSKLTLVILEYRDELKGPILRYSCTP